MNNGKNCLGETIDTNIVNIVQRIRYKKYVQAILNVSRGKYGSFIMISENSFSFTHTYAHRRIVLSIGTNYEIMEIVNRNLWRGKINCTVTLNVECRA